MKTTKVHFETFKTSCRRWIRHFGLYDWRIFFFHKNSFDNCFASYEADINGKIISIFLSEDWEDSEVTEAQLERTAFHEVCHILLCELSDFPFRVAVTRDRVDIEEHSIIRRLEHSYFEEIL